MTTLYPYRVNQINKLPIHPPFFCATDQGAKGVASRMIDASYGEPIILAALAIDESDKSQYVEIRIWRKDPNKPWRWIFDQASISTDGANANRSRRTPHDL